MLVCSLLLLVWAGVCIRSAQTAVSREPGLLAEWIFGHAKSGVVPDSSGHGYDARVCGRWRVVSGPGPGKALEFSVPGTRPFESWLFQLLERIHLYHPATPNGFWQGGRQNSGLSIDKRLPQGFSQLSVEAWLRKSTNWWMPIVYRDLWNSPSGFGMYAEWSSGKVAFGHYDDSNNGSWVFSKRTVQDGHWHHVVGTMQPADGQKYLYRIYVDGQLDNETTGAWSVQPAATGGGILKIGYPNSSGADQPYCGALGKVAIFDVALTPAQVKAHFDSGLFK